MAAGTKRYKAITRVLARQGEPMQSSDIAARAGIDPTQMNFYLNQLMRQGEIERVSRGVYALVTTNGHVPDAEASIVRTYTRKRSVDQRVGAALDALTDGSVKHLNTGLLLQWIELTKELIGG